MNTADIPGVRLYAWKQALLAAGSSIDDPVLHQDQCLTDWLRGQRFIVVSSTNLVSIPELVKQGYTIIIYKENS
jgi:hypothetical protein